jgi:deoxyribodipyrimidine photolyase
MTAHKTALVWLRRDLRLADNPALALACEQAQRW